jgi:hypothetical protein
MQQIFIRVVLQYATRLTREIDKIENTLRAHPASLRSIKQNLSANA